MLVRALGEPEYCVLAFIVLVVSVFCCHTSVLLVAYESGRGVSIRNAAVIAAVSGFLGGLFVRCREGDLRILIEQELVPDEGVSELFFFSKCYSW